MKEQKVSTVQQRKETSECTTSKSLRAKVSLMSEHYTREPTTERWDTMQKLTGVDLKLNLLVTDSWKCGKFIINTESKRSHRANWRDVEPSFYLDTDSSSLSAPWPLRVSSKVGTVKHWKCFGKAIGPSRPHYIQYTLAR